MYLSGTEHILCLKICDDVFLSVSLRIRTNNLTAVLEF